MIRAIREAVQERATASGEAWLFYSGAPWNAGGGCQRPQQLAEAAAASGAAVVHMCPSNANLVRRDGVVVRNVREWEAWSGLQAKRRVLVVAYPDQYSDDMLTALSGEWTVVYDCLDDWEEFVRHSQFVGILEIEKRFVRTSDHMTATARGLVNKWQAERTAANNNAIGHIPNSTMMTTLPWSAGRRSADCVGVGWWADVWVQWEYVEALCEAGLTVRLIGKPPQKNRLEHPNLEWCGMLPWRQCMGLLSQAKVGIVPFRQMPLVDVVDPVKYYDYMAAGLPTVASHMPELEGRPFAAVAHSREEFVELVRQALEGDVDRKAIRREAERNTNLVRFRQFKQHLEHTPLAGVEGTTNAESD